jgi:excisionase family DNA binding protein
MRHNNSGEFLTVQEVSSLLRLSVLTIYKYIKEKKISVVEFGGHYRISKSSLDNFIKAHTSENHLEDKEEKTV